MQSETEAEKDEIFCHLLKMGLGRRRGQCLALRLTWPPPPPSQYSPQNWAGFGLIFFLFVLFTKIEKEKKIGGGKKKQTLKGKPTQSDANGSAQCPLLAAAGTVAPLS